MTELWSRIALTWFACWLPAAMAAGQAMTDCPMNRHGPLRKASTVIVHLLDGQIENGKLRVNRIDSPYDTESFLDNTDGSVGSGGFSYAREKEWQLSYGNSDILLRIRQRLVPPDELWQDWMIEERSGPRRRVRLNAGPHDELYIELSCGNPPYLLRFSQAADGTCLVQELSEDGVATFQAPSIGDLCKQHHEFVSYRLLPGFSNAGIAQFKTPYHRQIVEAVRLRFQPLNEAELAIVNEWIAQLDSPVFAERQNASNSIAIMFKRHESLLLRMLAAEKLSPESLRRIRSAIRETGQLGADWVAALDMVESEALLQNAEYLNWLAALEKDETIRHFILAHLATLPPVELPAPTPAPPPHMTASVEPLSLSDGRRRTEAGSFAPFAKSIGRLVQITSENGQLTLNRQHWADQFGGKSIKDLIKETRDFMRDQGLPEHWLQVDTDNKWALDYPPVIFQHIQQEFATARLHDNEGTRWGHENPEQGWSETLQTRRMMLTLSWGRDSGGSRWLASILPTMAKSFQLRAEELVAPRRELTVESSMTGWLVLRLGSRDEHWALQIIQRHEGPVIVQDVRGQWYQVYRGDSFAELLEQHGSVLQGEILPAFRAVGIDFQLSANRP